MGKEDQTACIAHLGFVLHERSQENETGGTGRTQTTEDAATDVPERFLLRAIKSFLKSQELLSGAEQNAEAERFLDLVKSEAGLIVERGTDEDGESLYGFVHRTFQEYFAAVDVYERYQQEEDPSIISQFLREHLHDPHWREVILLLFGKLKRKPATAQLRQMLGGKIKSRCGQYTDIVQQDLFFVCDCLLDDIAVENEFVEAVISRLSDVVQNSPFPSQCAAALDYFGKFFQMRRCRGLVFQTLIGLTRRSDLSFKQTIQAFRKMYHFKLDNLERQQVTRALLALMQRTDAPFEEILEGTQSFIYWDTPDSEDWYVLPYKPEEEQRAIQVSSVLAQRPGLSFEQALLIARSLYISLSDESPEKRQALSMILSLAQQPKLSVEQVVQAIQIFCEYSIDETEEQRQATQILAELLQRPNLSVEQLLLATQALHMCSLHESDEQRKAAQILVDLAQRSDLSFEETLKVAEALYMFSTSGSEEQRRAIQMLKDLGVSDLPFEQAVQVAQTLYEWDRQYVGELLLNLSQQPTLPYEQALQFAEAIYHRYSTESGAGRVTQIALELEQRFLLSPEDALPSAQRFQKYHMDVLEEWYKVAQHILLRIIRQPDLPLEQTLQATQVLYQYSSEESQGQERRLATQTLLATLEPSTLTGEQTIRVAQILCQHGLEESQEKLVGIKLLLEIALRPDLSVEQRAQAAQILYQSSPTSSEERGKAAQVLLEIAPNPHLSFEKRMWVAKTFYEDSSYDTTLGKQPQATHILWQLLQNQHLTTDQRLQIATIPLTVLAGNYRDRLQAVRIVLTMLQEKEAKGYFEKQWESVSQYMGIKANPSDIPSIAELARQEILPTKVRDEMYRALRNMIPQFGSMDEINN